MTLTELVTVMGFGMAAVYFAATTWIVTGILLDRWHRRRRRK